MKRIIMFVLLFAALKVAGQTTGYLRFDTVKIMKQNGTCELYVINKTKDSLGVLTNVGGGLTRFIKSKVLNDSTIVIGLDTLVITGASGSGSTALNNVGTGHRLVATPGGNIKTLVFGYGVNGDSTTNANSITVVADTTETNHLITQSDLNDSSAAIRAAIGSGGGSSTFAGLSDVTVSSPKNGQVPVYDSVTSKWKNRTPVYYNVKDYGAVGDSTTDDRAAIMKARDAAYRGGGVLFFPAGKYRISDSILFIHPIRIQGVGKSAGLRNTYSSLEKDMFGPVQSSSEIVVTDGKSGFVFDRQPADSTKAAFSVERITMTSTVAPGSTTGGAFIVIRGMIQGTEIVGNTFYGGYIQVDVQSSFYQLVSGNHFSAPKIAGLKVGNNIRTDTGDFTVTENVFSSGTFNTISGTDSTKAIWWHSGGGMRVINNKFDVCEFDMSHAYVYDIYISNTLDPTSVIIIANNSIENWRKSAIYMRGIVAPYVRSITIGPNQFASVSSTGPAIDIDHMESVFVGSGNVMRDWSNSVSAPAIKITNTTDVTIDKVEWRDYTSFIDLTGSTNVHLDYMHGGDVAIGSRNTTNVSGVDATLYATATIKGRATTGLFGSGMLEIVSQLQDAAGADVGYIEFASTTNYYPRMAMIGATTEGTTAGDRGGKLSFYTKGDGGFSMPERMSISQAGKVAIQIMDSVGTPTGGCVFRDAATKELRLAPCGSGSSQWITSGSDIYYDAGNVSVTGSTTGSKIFTIENTNSGASARAMLQIKNDGGLVGQFGSMSSTHATLPNFTLFEALHSLQFGTDQGVSSGGTSVINFVTGGYSNSPSLQIKSNGHVLINTTTDNTANFQVNGNATVADDAYNATNWNGNFEVPTKNAIRDKIESLSGGNGIYGGNGTLPSDVTVSTGGNTLTVSGSNDNETSFSVTNTGTTSASAIAGTASGTTSTGVTGTSSSYIGVFGTSTTNTGVQGQSSSGVGVIGTSSTNAALRGQVNQSTNNAIENIVTLLRTYSGGAGANGIGGAIQYELETATNGNSQTAGSLAFKWSDATALTRSADFEIYGVNNATTARKAALASNGKWTWDGYGSGTHTATPATTPVISSSGVVGERIAPKIYTALLSQSGTSDPTATVLGTNEIGTIVWTRNSTGNYTGTLTGAFTSNKTWLMVPKGDGTGSFVNNILSWTSANAVLLTTTDNGGTPTDGFTNMSLEIRVYP